MCLTGFNSAVSHAAEGWRPRRVDDTDSPVAVSYLCCWPRSGVAGVQAARPELGRLVPAAGGPREALQHAGSGKALPALRLGTGGAAGDPQELRALRPLSP